MPTTSKLAHFYETIPGFFWFEEAYTRLLETLPKDRPSRWVEIGSFQGRSAAWLAVEVANRGLDTQIHCVDSFESWEADGIPQGAALEELFRENTAPVADRLQLWPMRSTVAAQEFAEGSLDVVFVDGAHDYESVRDDIAAWWPKLRPGGFMAGDDFMMRPVMQAVTERFAPSGYILVHGLATQPEPLCWPSWLAYKR